MRIYTDRTVDTEFKDLGDLGFTGTLNDRQFAFLRDAGYTNSLADMMYQRRWGGGGTQSGADIAAAIAAASNGATVEISPIFGQTVTLSAITKTGVTVRQVSGSPIRRLTASGVTGLTFEDVAFQINNAAGTDFSPTDVFQLVVMTSGSNMRFRNCNFSSPSGANKRKRFGGIRATSSTLTVEDCSFTDLRDAVVCNGGTATVTGCHFERLYEDAVTGVNTDFLAVDDNTATVFEGDYGKRYFGTISGTLTVGEVLTNGLSGTARKVLEVVAVSGGYIDGYYNNFAAPQAGETYTGAAGSIAITSVTSDFDGIHGDFFQPLMNTATANRIIRARRNFVYRTFAFDHSLRMSEQNVQGILAQLNGSSFNWSEADLSGNVIMGGQAIGIVLEGALSGQMIFNTIASAEHGNPSRIRLSDSTNITVAYNAGNNGSGGVLSDDGGNVGTVLTGNTLVTSVTTSLANPFTYPQTLAGLAPAIGQNVDVAGSGALTTAGAFRALVLPSALPEIADASLTTGSSTGATTITQAYTAPAGSNRRVLVAVHGFYAAQTTFGITCTWGGVNMTQLAIIASNGSGGVAFERLALFEIREADFPSGATGNIVATCSASTPSNMGLEAVTIRDVGSGAAVVETSFNAAMGTITDDITPSAADSLVVGIAASSNSASGADWTAGLTEFGTQHIFGATATDLWGSKRQGATLLTCTPNYSSGRAAMILAAFAP